MATNSRKLDKRYKQAFHRRNPKANNHLKICLVSLVIREMKIMKQSHHFTPTILAKIQKPDRFGSGCKAMETLTHRCWEWKQPQSFLKTIWHCFVKLNKYTPHKSAILLPECTPENLLCRSIRRFRRECSQQPHLEEQANKKLEKTKQKVKITHIHGERMDT